MIINIRYFLTEKGTTYQKSCVQFSSSFIHSKDYFFFIDIYTKNKNPLFKLSINSSKSQHFTILRK